MNKKLKVLWIINILMPYPCQRLSIPFSNYGGWLVSLSNLLKESNEIILGIATVYNGNEYKVFKDDKIKYFLLPYNETNSYSSLKEYWPLVVSDFKPNLVHIHGSEYPYGLSFQEMYPDMKTVLSIQGFVSECAKHYYDGIDLKKLKKCNTYNSLRYGGIENEYKWFLKNSNTELDTIKNVNAIIGRTMWDKDLIHSIDASKAYFVNNENLRDVFYINRWNIRKIEKHSIFCSSATYPIKGFHVLLEALPILVDKYPDLKVYIAGSDIFYGKNFIKRLLYMNNYKKYLFKLIKSSHLKKHIIFTGNLNDKEMCSRYLKSNIYIQNSSVENSSNALCEAMILGVPCVASNVGGTSSLLTNGIDGLLYDFGNIEQIVNCISKIFDNDDFAIKLGTNARKRAINTHNKNSNLLELVKIYKSI